MRVRSITHFIPLAWPFTPATIAGAARLLADARTRLVEAGIEVESICLATPPFLDVLGDPKPGPLLDFAHRLDDLAEQHHLDLVSIGRSLPPPPWPC
jgi:nucleotide-binding universal stress UspA family protein